jgi:hypothetical protein
VRLLNDIHHPTFVTADMDRLIHDLDDAWQEVMWAQPGVPVDRTLPPAEWVTIDLE